MKPSTSGNHAVTPFMNALKRISRALQSLILVHTGNGFSPSSAPLVGALRLHSVRTPHGFPDGFYAGSLDCLLRGEDNNGEMVTILADLKTLSSHHSSTRSIARQAGAYIALLCDVEQIHVDRVLGVFSKPGSVEITVEDPQTCLEAWVDCLDLFKNWKPSF